MRRLYLLLLFCLLFPALGVQSQDKPKVAVYTTDESDYNIGAFVGDYLINAIVKRGEYIAIERTAQFLSEINKEQSFQRTGAVDDSQISRLGKNMGVQYVCVVKVARVGAQLFMSARLIDVETAEVKSTARPVSFNPDNLQDMESACDDLVASMFGEKSVGVGSSIGRSHPAEPEMVFVEGGTFLMGCTSEQGGDCPYGNQLVTVSDFYISKYEITQGQWEAIMGTSIRQQRDKANREWPIRGEGANYPMYYVSWNEVQEFISRLNSLTGKQYRLPTEAEWEYAARGGKKSKGYKYSGSNFIEHVAWYKDNSDNMTHPVGSKQSNELGIYDMSGNVFEWCYDWYGAYGGSGSKTNPIGPGSGSFRVNRGGSWGIECGVSFRNSDASVSRGDYLGFRLVCPK